MDHRPCPFRYSTILQEGKQLKTFASTTKRIASAVWYTCVEQILGNEGITVNSSEERLPRLWWIGASQAPCRAMPAGLHSQISTENVYCRAISSYTPSIKALAYARGRR